MIIDSYSFIILYSVVMRLKYEESMISDPYSFLHNLIFWQFSCDQKYEESMILAFFLNVAIFHNFSCVLENYVSVFSFFGKNYFFESRTPFRSRLDQNNSVCPFC